jgi:2-(1,2-epoxy-1,2-dihydrophenyl)acetyl-CoA isomerase
MEQSLKSRIDERVLVLTMNRPERRNAFSPEMEAAMLAALEAADGDDGIGAIVVTGAPPAFSAGGDVKRMAEAPAAFDDQERFEQMRRRCELTRMLHEIGKPTIAMINGAAVGAGLSLAMACDLRIAARSATFTTGFIKIGLAGDFGIHYFLNRVIGAARARELLLTSRTVDSEEAEAIELVTRVVEDSALEAKTLDVARQLANGPGLAYRLMKHNLNVAESSDCAAVIEVECRNHMVALRSEDHREAAQAFAAKRPPRFVGR